MRRILFICFSLVSIIGISQAPQYINYQAIARDAANNIVTSQIGIKFEIFRGSVGGTLVYEETHTATPSSAGIFTVNIGAGTVITGNFGAIAWANGPYFLQVNIDPNGGTSYLTAGASKLVSVPYALYAEKAGNAANYSAGNGITITTGTITNAAPDQTVTLTQGSNITVGGTYPNFSIASNPSLSITGNSLSISGGNGVLIPSSGTFIATPNTSLTSTGNISISTSGTNTYNLSVPFQTLNIGSNVLSISGGNSVTLPVPPALTLNATGIAAVSPTVGNNFTINVPPVGINFIPSSGILSYSPAPGINTINISPAISFSNTILSVGSNTVPIPGTGLWARPSATATILNNSSDNVGIGTNNPASKLEVVSSSFDVLTLRTTAGGNTNVNVDGVPSGTGYFQFRTYTPNGISFVTNNLNRMRIESNGNVGIGTVTPSAPLDVSGKTVTDSIQISGPALPATGAVLVSRDNTGNAKWSAPVIFKANYAPAAAITINTSTIGGIGGTAAYSSASVYNVGSGLSINASGMLFTAPVTGYYNVTGSLIVSLSPASVGNNHVFLELYNVATGTALARAHSNCNETAFLYTTLRINTVVSLIAGQQIALRVGGSMANAGSITTNYSPQLINEFSGFLIR